MEPVAITHDAIMKPSQLCHNCHAHRGAIVTEKVIFNKNSANCNAVAELLWLDCDDIMIVVPVSFCCHDR